MNWYEDPRTEFTISSHVVIVAGLGTDYREGNKVRSGVLDTMFIVQATVYRGTFKEPTMRFWDFFYAEPQGQTWLQFGELALALVLSSLIGLEREFRAKSAGLRTHTLVGVAAALIMLVSKYGFGDTIVKYAIVLDPSRVAAQIVSGIGFIGGGLIFVQRDIVRGLQPPQSSG